MVTSPKKRQALPPAIKALNDAKRGIERADRGYHDALRNTLQDVAEQEVKIRKDPQLLKAFCELPHWKGKKSRPSAEAGSELRLYMFKYVMSDRKNCDKDASRYNQAVEALLVDGVPREKIAESLKERGGIQEVYKEYRLKNEKGKKTDNPPQKTPHDLIMDARRSYIRAVQGIDADMVGLFIDLDPDELATLLDSREGSKFSLRVINSGVDESGFVQIELLESPRHIQPPLNKAKHYIIPMENIPASRKHANLR